MAEREFSRRRFLIGVSEVFVGGAVFGKGFMHLGEGVLTVKGRTERVKAELEAQGVTEPSPEVVKTAEEIIREDNKKPMAEKNTELVGQATQHLTQKVDFDIRNEELFTRRSAEEGHSGESHLNPTATFLFDMRTTPRYVPPAYLAYHQEATYVTSLSDRW